MKTAKTIYLIAIITITVFVVIFFGGRKIKAFRGLFGNVDMVNDSVSLEPFKEIDLEADAVEFEIVEGEDYHVDYEYPSSMTLKGGVENDVLKIELKGKKNQAFGFFRIDPGKMSIKNVEPKITVTVPENTEFKKADLKIDAGNVNLSDRIIDELKADCDAGNFNLKRITAEKLDVTADAGNVEIKDSTLGDCKFDTSAGRIKVDDSVMNSVNAETSMGEIDFDNTTFGKGEVNSDLGKISIDGTFDELKSTASMGNIEVDNTNDAAKYDISIDMGEINVNGDSKGTKFSQE